MKPINLSEIKSLQRVKQHFHDCYLVTSMNALSNTEMGVKYYKITFLEKGTTLTLNLIISMGNQKTFLYLKKT